MFRAPGFTPSMQVRPIENPFARRPYHEFGGLGVQGFGSVPPFIDLIAPGEDFRVPSMFTRNSSALRTNALATFESIATNQPIWDYNPNIKRTQLQVNTPLAGAVVGGAYPTGWTVGSQAGVNRTLTGIGVEFGMPYIDIRIQSSSWTGAGVIFRPMGGATLPTVAQGQTYTGSLFIRMVDGSTAGLQQFTHTIIERNSGAYLSEGGSSSGAANLSSLAGGSLQRFSSTRTIQSASANQAEHYFYFVAVNGSVVDITIRVYHPQFEAGAVATDRMINPSTTSPISFAEFRGIRHLPSRTNKCTHFNISPTALTNIIREGDAAATLTVVNDAAALAAAGLNIGNGNVYCLDNTAGIGVAGATIQGGVGTLNPHAFTAYCRCTGTASVRRNAIGTIAGSSFTNISSYQRFGGVLTPTQTTDRLSINANPGAVVWFTLADLQEGAFITDPIIVAGAQTTRFADIDTTNDLSWFNPLEGTFVFEYETPFLTQNEVLLCLDSGINNRMVIQHGINTVNFAVITGGVVQFSSSQVISAPATVKVAFGYKDGDFGFSVNQGATAPGASGTVPVVSVFRKGRDPSNVNNSADWSRRLRYCPLKLPNSMMNLL
jgi:hypothetical protein